MHLKEWLMEKKAEAKKKGKRFWNKDFAIEIGVSDATLSLWINGHVFPSSCSIKFIEKITKGKVTLEDFQQLHNKHHEEKNGPDDICSDICDAS